MNLSNKAVKPFACGSLGHSVQSACLGMASPSLPEQALCTECRLLWRCRGHFALVITHKSKKSCKIR